VSLFLNAFRLAFGAILRNKLRAALTVLGIMIGVFAVVSVVAIASGAATQVADKLESFAANAVYVHPRPTQASGARSKTSGRITENDAKAIAREAVSITGVGYWLDTHGQVIFGDKNINTEVIGTNLAYFPIRKWEIDKGAFWTESDELLKTKVCVIGTTVRDKLFGPGVDPVGHTIRIAGFPFRVIGLTKQRGGMMGGDDQDDRVMMPTGSWRARVQHTSPGRLDQLIMGATSAETVEHAMHQVAEILRQRHHIAPDAPDDFEINSQAQMREMEEKVAGMLSKLLLGVATISLVVGGIGVMNIMLVSVTERTREIGIRMSIGAREGDILTQFLIEAVVLSCIGGIAGMVLGVGVVALIGFALDMPLSAGPGAMAIAVGTSAAIGLFFGFVPARRAAKLDPIDALRTD
jgi:putative ABC transport system permease protein